MSQSNRSQVLHLADVRGSINWAAGEHAVGALERGSLKLKLSCPVPPNQQSPHEQDEIYVIMQGHGVLFHDGRRDRMAAGDLAFVAAGTEHHFEDFSEDLTVWVIFYGPKGGENPE